MSTCVKSVPEASSKQEFPGHVSRYPQLRFMGSKYRLLNWIHDVLRGIGFDTALDAFSGSGCVAYLLKAMGKGVVASDFLRFSCQVSKALIENERVRIDDPTLEFLLSHGPRHQHFIERTFQGIFYTAEELRFLDRVSWNIRQLEDPYVRALAISALVRSCVKRQPRGVFTVAGDPKHYKDGRRDLRLTLREHFIEQVAVYNGSVFSNGRRNRSIYADVFEVHPGGYDLVYLDPPYVPRHDDNCYIKRYHFLEGLSCYWEGLDILEDSKVKKLRKPYTPFSYRSNAIEAFDRLFRRFRASVLVLSYSSNGYPDLKTLVTLIGRQKNQVTVHRRNHRYHFGTHVAAVRNQVEEYLIVGT